MHKCRHTGGLWARTPNEEHTLELILWSANGADLIHTELNTSSMSTGKMEVVVVVSVTVNVPKEALDLAAIWRDEEKAETAEDLLGLAPAE